MGSHDALGEKPRKLTAVTVPKGEAGPRFALPALKQALDGSGPAIAPMPDGPAPLVSLLKDAIKPDDPSYPLERNDVAIVAATSGSTGQPRGVLLTQSSIYASANAYANRFGRDARWVLAVPAHRIAGLMVMARAHIFGNPFEVDPSIGGYKPFNAVSFAATTLAAQRKSAIDGKPLMVSLVPTQIARLLEAGPVGIEALQAYAVVLSGAAATPQPLLERVRALGINISISYGMTETCGGCVFDGRPLEGVNVSLRTQDDAQPGRISISGPVVAAGYRLRRDLNSVTFIDGRLVTHDVGKLDSDNLLHVLGRLDDVVIVGGVNVALSAVEALIRHHPDIEDVAVIDIVDDLWGSLPMAYVVLRNANADTHHLTTAIQEVIASRIGRAATPRVIHFVQSLPMLDSGKVDRLNLRLQAAQDVKLGNVRHPGLAD